MHSVNAKAAALMDDATIYPAALGCMSCPLLEPCGGLHCKASPLACDEFCCGMKDGCTTVCRNHPEFLEQLAEVGGINLHNLPVVIGPSVALDADVVPLIYHGSKRSDAFSAPAIALRLIDLIDFKTNQCRYASRTDLCSALKINEACQIVLTGVDQDPSIERIWRLGSARASVFADIARLSIACATTPNFSMILDVPRTDNLHAMKRIGIVFNEMSEAGLAVALHVNGRTERDFEQWARFLEERPSIGAVSYEFITGAGLAARLPNHLHWLNRLIERANRPLVCIVRGNPACLDGLDARFTPVYIETTSFVKAIKRQHSMRFGNASLRWSTSFSQTSNDVSAELSSNFSEVRQSLLARHPSLASRTQGVGG